MRPVVAGLTERRHEIEALTGALDAARAGGGSVVVLRADAGLGKSALLGAAADLARARDLTVLRARAAWLDSDVPFGLARRLLAPAVRDPDVRERVFDGDAASARDLLLGEWTERTDDVAVELREGLCSVVAALSVRRPLALLADDLQWADRQSLRFLLSLAGRIDDLAVTVLGARRPEAPDGDTAPLLDALEADRACRTLRPAPLSAQAVADLVAVDLGGDPGLADACLRASGGNPFHLRELLRELRSAGREAPSPASVAGTVPASVTRSIAVRLARLPASATALARALSILGDDTSVALAARLAELSASEAERAADALADVALVEPGDPLTFTHSLVGSAIYDDQTAFARMRAHRRAAEVLMDDPAQDERAAAHLLLARPQADAAAADLLLRAATLARVRGESPVAVRMLERALEEEPPPPLRAELLVELAGADLANGSALADERLSRALELRADDPEQQARTLRAHAAVRQHSGDLAGAAEACRRGLAMLPDDHPLTGTLRAGFVGAALLWPPLRAEADAVLAQAMTATRTGQPPDNPALCAQLAIHAAETGWADQVVRDIAERAFSTDPLVDGDSLGMSLGYASQALVWVDALEPARARSEAAVTSARRRGAAMALAVAHVNQAVIALHHGRLVDAVQAAQQALDVHRYGWTNSTWSTPVLAEAQLELGDVDAARAALALGARADAVRPDRALLLEARARVAFATGDADAALADALAVGDQLPGASPRLFRWRTLAARAAFELGDRTSAAALIATATDEVRALGTARQLGETLTVAGIVTGGAKGRTLLAEAVDVLSASPSRLQYARSLVEWGSALRRAGRRGEARGPLTQALQLASDFGAVPLGERATRELNLVGVRPRRSAVTGSDALTAAERSVAELAAAGHGNVEIARRLFVTRKTVESHLSHVYRKLGITGRAALAQRLDRPSPRQ